MNLILWAIKHHVKFKALQELRELLIGTVAEAVSITGLNETTIQARIRLEASRKGMKLWRNNVGAVINSKGKYLRYGLCNDSHKLNQSIKSSDLIGIRPITIKPDHVGNVIGQFVALEVKPSNWSYKDNKHEKAQLKFLQIILAHGGHASFIKNIRDL